MSCQSTILKNLLFQDCNPKKTEVEFEINGWLQTNRKTKNNPKPKHSKYYQKQGHLLHLKLSSIPNERTQNYPFNDQLLPSNLLGDKSDDIKQKQMECRMTTASSHQSRRKMKAQLTINEIIAVRDDKDKQAALSKIKVFNSGYIVNQMRRKLKQKQSLKKYISSKFSLTMQNDRPVLLNQNNHQLINNQNQHGSKPKNHIHIHVINRPTPASLPMKNKTIEKMQYLSHRR